MVFLASFGSPAIGGQFAKRLSLNFLVASPSCPDVRHPPSACPVYSAGAKVIADHEQRHTSRLVRLIQVLVLVRIPIGAPVDVRQEPPGPLSKRLISFR